MSHLQSTRLRSMAAAAGGERCGAEPESWVGWVSVALDLVQVSSIQHPLPTQLL